LRTQNECTRIAFKLGALHYLPRGSARVLRQKIYIWADVDSRLDKQN
jgi:hypothetical protein